MQKVLITGITGQDGLFLTNILLHSQKKYEIVGITRALNSRDIFYNNLKNITKKEGFNNSIELVDVNLLNPKAIEDLIKSFSPDFVYNLSGPSSVYNSFIDKSIHNSILNIFENLTGALIKNNLFPKFFQASSSELFSNSEKPLSETSALLAKSPYAEAKLLNHFKVFSLKENYSWPIFSGLMFNHESEFRKNEYLIMQIINGAINISKKKADNLTIGSLNYIRDWSYAGDIAEAIYNITENGSNTSYVIGSGEGHKILDVLEIVFGYFKLDWENHVLVDESLLRKGDPEEIVSDPSLILKELNWKTTTPFESMIVKCIESKIHKL